MSATIFFSLFLIASVFLSFFLGVVMTTIEARPTGFLLSAVGELLDFRAHWRNDLGLEPTRFLVAAHPNQADPPAATSASATPGYRLIAGHLPDRESPNGAVLLRAPGEEVHFWPIDYGRLDPDGADPRNVFLHGVAAFPDGSLMVNFDNGDVLARIDACGEVVWRADGAFHHAISPAWNGTVWTLEGRRPEEVLTQIDPDDGATLRQIALIEDVIETHRGAAGIFRIRMTAPETGPRFLRDPFHVNDIEVLSPALAKDFPDFRAGDIMINLRSLNLVAVLGGEDLKPKWWQHGPWHRQHDPDFMPGGTISVLDNNMHGGTSRIVEVDPATGRTRDLFRGSPESLFYTSRRGKHQHLASGNILITEPEAGRAFEVTAAGEIAWEFENRFDEGRNLLISKAMHLPADFFRDGAPGCRKVAGDGAAPARPRGG
jgi:hypothetical protein